MEIIAGSLEGLQRSLKGWDKEVFGSVKKQLASLRKELEEERSTTLYRGPSQREKQLMRKLSELVACEETMEQQWSRVQWLQEGDRNTGFFQAKARARAHTNRIKGLRCQDGSWTKVICQFVPTKVTHQMNLDLDRPFTCEEVEAALFMMKPNKSPGVDGFTAGFFQKRELVKPISCRQCWGS